MTSNMIPTPDYLTALLRETETRHADAEKRLPKHDWQVWYGAYMAYRFTNNTPELSQEFADLRATGKV